MQLTKAESILEQDQADQQVLEDVHSLARALYEKIKYWFNESSEATLFIGLDGMPGAGKTTHVQSIQNIVAKIANGLQEKVVPIDAFLAAERSEREKITQTSTPVFVNRFANWRAIDKLLQRVQANDGAPVTMKFPQMYNRKDGKLRPGEFHVPKGRKVVIVEGANATSVINKLKSTNAPLITIFIDCSPEQAIFQAVKRDANNKSRSVESGYVLRTGEAQHWIPVLGENGHMADFIFSVR